MPEKVCERCGGQNPPPKDNPRWGPAMLDYCAECSKDLCDKCMAKGCCGNVPAKSGTNENNGDE